MKTPFFKYHKSAKTKCVQYFEKFLCQFRDISAENRPSKFHQFTYNPLQVIVLTKKGDIHTHPKKL